MSLSDHHAQLVDAAAAGAIKYGNAAAISGGLWAWIGDNAPQIGAVCAMVGAVMAIAGHIAKYMRERQCAACAARSER